MPDSDQIFDNQTRSELPIEMPREENSGGWGHFFRQNKIVIAFGVALVLIAGIFVYFLSGSKNPITPTSTNVILQIKGPTQITSGNEAEYTVIYRNGENADLTNVSLELLYPTGFKFKSAEPLANSSSGQFFTLPLVKEGKDGQVVIRGKLSGSTSEDKELKAKLHYKLSNFNSEFAVESSIHTSILPPDLTMDIAGPVAVVNGQDTTFSVNITNVTSQDFDNLALQLSYPQEFRYTSSNLLPSKSNNYWKLATLKSGSSVNIEVTGSFVGEANDEDLVRADLGQIINNTLSAQISATATFRIIPSSLSLKLTSSQQDYVKLGDIIQYKLEYANQGSIGMSNLNIVVTLNSTALDMPRLSAPNAIVTGNTITWKAASLPNLSNLSPNEKGILNFSVPVKNTPTSNLKNQMIVASSQITSDEMTKPTKALDVQLKLISELSLDVTGDYVSGAAPMQVGKTTTFALTFLLSNLSNDVENTEVVASMPLPSSAWKNIIVPPAEAERLSFDPNSGKIKWHLGLVPAFVGKYSPVMKVTFQLQVTPTETDKGKIITLLKDIQVTGTDTFVNQSLQSTVPTVDTGSIDDDVLNTKGVTVQ